MIKPNILNLTLVVLFMSGTLTQAIPLDAELVMGEGRVWKGQIMKRDGDWLEFRPEQSPDPIRIGVSMIKGLNFSVSIDARKLSEMMENREFDAIIGILIETINPFDEYKDIPSNLIKYNAMLMEIYYRTQQFDKLLAISSEISEDDRNPKLQEKARMYQVLALIDAGKSGEVEAVLKKYGWDQSLSDDSSPDKLYIAAKVLLLNKQYNKAIEQAAKVVVFSSQDPEWMRPAEMLCAEIYTELGLLDSADEVCREILMLYKNTPEFEKAEKLKVRIKELRDERKREDGLKANEA